MIGKMFRYNSNVMYASYMSAYPFMYCKFASDVGCYSQ